MNSDLMVLNKDSLCYQYATFTITSITTVVVTGMLYRSRKTAEFVLYVTMLASSGCRAVGASQLDPLDRFDLGSRRLSCHLKRLLVLVTRQGVCQ